MLEVELSIITPVSHMGSTRKNIGKLKIVKLGDSDLQGDYANYVCHHENGSFMVHDHHRPDGAWVLVKRCIEGLLGEAETR